MKSSIAIAVAALFVTGTAFAQNVETKKAPTQVAQSQAVQVAQAGGAAMGAGAATGGVAGTTLSASAIVAIGAGTAVVVGASGSNSTTNH